MKKNIMKSMILGLAITSLQVPVLGEEKKETAKYTIVKEEAKNETVRDITINKQEEKEVVGQYVSRIGKIEEINKSEQNVSILVKDSPDENKYGIIFNIFEETLVIDNSTTKKIDPRKLKVGDKVKVYYGINTPSAKSLPEQLTPEVIVLTKEDNELPFVHVDNFDKNGLSSDGSLKLMSLENTEVVDKDEKTISKTEVLGNDLVVFYDITTRSIPPQTTPRKVIVLKNKNTKIEDKKENTIKKDDKIKDIENNISKKIKEIISSIKEESILKVDENKFLPLHLVAEKLGYDIKWEESTKKIIMSKESSKIIIEIGSKNFEKNSKKDKFKSAPFIKNDRTYVEQSFIDKL